MESHPYTDPAVLTFSSGPAPYRIRPPSSAWCFAVPSCKTDRQDGESNAGRQWNDQSSSLWISSTVKAELIPIISKFRAFSMFGKNPLLEFLSMEVTELQRNADLHLVGGLPTCIHKKDQNWCCLWNIGDHSQHTKFDRFCVNGFLHHPDWFFGVSLLTWTACFPDFRTVPCTFLPQYTWFSTGSSTMPPQHSAEPCTVPCTVAAWPHTVRQGRNERRR